MTKSRKLFKPLLFCVYFVGCLASLGLALYSFISWREAGYRIVSWFYEGTGKGGDFPLVLVGIALFVFCLSGLVRTTRS
jgi:hypothetical protein